MPVGLAIIPVARSADLEAQARKQSEQQNAQPVIQGLAAHVRKRWSEAKDAKQDLEERMLQCLRQRSGEYDPETLSAIKQQGGSELYVQLTSVKCRAATSWLRDTLLGTGSDKPWALSATPEPTLPPEVTQGLMQALQIKAMQQIQNSGVPPDESMMREMATTMRDATMRKIKEEAELRVSRMEQRMEDQLVEGGFHKALDEFLDDLVTFPFGCIKGPVKRMRKKLEWKNGGLEPVEEVRNEWERIDPFMLYWAPWASRIDEGYVIERHKLTRDALESLIGVEGYSEEAIRTVLSEFTNGGLNEWLWVDSAKAEVEGKDVTATTSTGDLIDALQLWDSVSGKTLKEWGLDDELDPHLSYPCEVWLIGRTVIKAVLNYDPLGRKPYYVASYEALPGRIDGRGVPDLCRDSQRMVNAAGRALANNMGISSGPQVGVNISRLPPGTDITQMTPWQIWQFTSSDYNDGSDPLRFFQPQSNAQELMRVFEHFALRADEDTMIPKYMVGGHQQGAARTSSGLSMLISNAGKGIKQVISNIDTNIITRIVERLYHDNLRYADDPELVGDLQIVAKGANSLVVKEMEAARKMEFLQIVLNSPLAQQIVGPSGAAELLRDMASNYDINVDRLVPDRPKVEVIDQQAQMIQQLQMQLEQMSGEMAQGGGGSPAKPQSRNLLPDGSPVGGNSNRIAEARAFPMA